MIEEKIIKKIDETLETILCQDMNTSNLDSLAKLVKTRHIAKEDEDMNYGFYRDYRGNYGREQYGNYGNYGRRGVDSPYRGYEGMDRMYNEYGRYMESRGRYGASHEETDRSFHYMIKALEDFIKVLYEEAETPQQSQQLREALQRSVM